MARHFQILVMILLPLAAALAVVVAASFLGFVGRGAGFVERVELASIDAPVKDPEVAGDKSLPLVVIDAGHGGHDPGATAEGYVEKDLVLALALALRDELERRQIARVALTRDEDVYLLHNERFRIAQRLDADLFLSIHADSAGQRGEVTGASIYTLSQRASSKAAALFAQRENASDVLDGVDLSKQDQAVSDILVQLSQRRTLERSAIFASLIQREGAGQLEFHPQARQSAWLAVLRAPDVPSVLFESGFISNETDAQRLASPEGKALFADVMARAIQAYFARREAS